MYAIFESGGKQYRVAPGQKVRVETLPLEVGAELEFTSLKAVSNADGQLLMGGDLGSAKVIATVTKQGRGDKLIVFKFKRRKQYRRTYGHRQNFTELSISEVVV